MTRIITATWLLILTGMGFSQDPATGAIFGKVYDDTNGEPLIGAGIRIEGSEQVVFTDLDGAFAFEGVKPGTYVVVGFMDGFSETKVQDVVVAAGQRREISLNMGVAGVVAELVVTAASTENSEVGLLRYRRKSSTISDAISVEEIKRAGGGNAADAMSRVTGASVVDGKYVTIRGLGDRYTSTHLNGVELPTADPDVKAFQADLFPSQILDHIVTVKSFTPEKPGNFTGGIIDIATSRYPTEFTYDISFSWAHDENATGNDDFLLYKGSGSDWRGSDDGLRALPGILDGGNTSIPDPFTAQSNEQEAQLLNDISKSFTPVMSPTAETGSSNKNFGVSVGDQVSLFGRKLGYLATFSYSRKNDFRDNWERARWKMTEPGSDNLSAQSNFMGSKGTDKVNWGGLLTANYMVSSNHELSANVIYTQGGESSAQYYEGQWPEQFSSNNAFLESRVLKYTERNLNSWQARGRHYFPDFLESSFDWSASFAKNTQDEPDTRIFTDNYSIRTVNGEEARNYSITPSIYNNPARYYRELSEDTTTFGLNWSIPVQWMGAASGELKFGLLSESKDRSFLEDRYEYTAASAIRFNGDPESYFSDDMTGIIGYDGNTGRYIFGNVIQQSPDARGGNYEGEMDLLAYYGQVDLPLTDKLRAIAGARMESAEMSVFNGETRGELNDDDLLPSLNLIYQLSGSMNLRGSYGRTLARPTFREKAPYASFDFIADGIYLGNPDLKRTLIDNLDLRWEMYPGAGELIAASVFYKKMENPIERAYNIRFASEFGEKTYLNVDEAEIQGLELEFRKRFDAALQRGDSSSVFSVSANLTFMESTVDIPPEELAFLLLRDPEASSTRSLQGEAGYIVNLGLNYDHVDLGTAVSLLYNATGERLYEVGIGGAPDSLEQPRDALDMTFSQPIKRRFTLKFSARNLLDDDYLIQQRFKGVDYVRSRYRAGRVYSLSLTYKP